MYIDECGLQEAIHRDDGWAEKGKRILSEKPGKRSTRTSIIAGLHQGKAIAPFYFEGYCDTELVLIWVEKVLLPELKPGMVTLWDNASFHKHSKIRELIESAACQLIFLPPYSPDMNPIEQFWATLKAWIRKIRKTGMTLKQTICQAFKISH